MKKVLQAWFLIGLFTTNIFAFGLNFTEGKYALDSDHTRVSFIINHYVISEVEGRFNDVKGNFILKNKFKDSSADITVAIASIDTGVAKRDEHLKSTDFFEVKAYPVMTFKSKKFTGTLEKFKVVGDLTIKDVTKEITLSGSYTGSIIDMMGNVRAGIKASGKINRRDFNIKFSDMVDKTPLVGDIVTINIIAQGVLERLAK